MREMFVGCVELLAADIYASRTHFVLELLQNADDNEFGCEGGTEPTARFLLSRGCQTQGTYCPYIAISNTEVGLNAQDVAGMCAISRSSKLSQADRTGRKGIGFKSIFAVSSCPHVLSGAFTFKFDVQSDRMGYVTPTWLEKDEISRLPLEVQEMHRTGLTVIYLPLLATGKAELRMPAVPAGLGPAASGMATSPANSILTEVEGMLDALDPATLLFLRRLRCVEFRPVDGSLTTLTVKRNQKPTAAPEQEVVSITTKQSCRDGAEEATSTKTFAFLVSRNMPLSEGSVEPGPVSLALPISASSSGSGVFEITPQRAFATLPLCHTGLLLALNADWDVSASRTGVHENSRNERLVTLAAQAFADVAKHVDPSLLPFSPLEYLGDRPPLQRFWRWAREQFFRALMDSDVACVPAEVAEGVEQEGCGKFGPEREGLVAMRFALRRPGPAASSAEQAACALVSAGVLRQALGMHFAREPLPPGLRLEFFSRGHFISCMGRLVEEAVALISHQARSQRLAEIFSQLHDSLMEVAPVGSEGSVLERARLLRQAAFWPVLLDRSEPELESEELISSQVTATPLCAFCALEDGPIFASMGEGSSSTESPSENGSGGAFAFRFLLPKPTCRDGLLQPKGQKLESWRLRVLSPEAQEALHQTPGLAPLLGIRQTLEKEHIMGLCLDLHALESCDGKDQAPSSDVWWSSLEVFRDAWESKQRLQDANGQQQSVCSEIYSAKAGPQQVFEDSLSELGAAFDLLEPWRLRSLLFVPSTCGKLLHGPALACPLLLGQLVVDFCSSFGVGSVVGGRHMAALPPGRSPTTTATAITTTPTATTAATSAEVPLILERLRWERFLVEGLGAKSLAAEMLSSQLSSLSSWTTTNNNKNDNKNDNNKNDKNDNNNKNDKNDNNNDNNSLSRAGALSCPSFGALLLSRDWWLGIALAGGEPAEKLLARLVEQHGPEFFGSLPVRQSGSVWLLREHFSRDFEPFFAGVSSIGPNAVAAPLMDMSVSELTCAAQHCLRHMGVTLDLDGATLVNKCLNVLLQACENGLQVPKDNFTLLYATLHDTNCNDEVLLNKARSGIFMPERGCGVALESCVFLPARMQGLASLVGKKDLQPVYPGLRDFFVCRLGVCSSLTASDCLCALRSVRDSTSVSKDVEGGWVVNNLAKATHHTLTQLAAGAYFQLEELLQVSQEGPKSEGPESEIELAIRLLQNEDDGLICAPQRELEHWTVSWLPLSRCMWYDLPPGFQQDLCSMEAQYPPSLKRFFVFGLGMAEVNTHEVESRFRALAAEVETSNQAALQAAYASISRHIPELSSHLMESFTQLLSERLLFVPGFDQTAVRDHCVFLPPAANGLAALLGKVDLGLPYPGLEGFFVGCLGLPSCLTTEECLVALRTLQLKKQESLSMTLGLAAAAYSFMEQDFGGRTIRVVDISIVFDEEPLLCCPGPVVGGGGSQAPLPLPVRWRRAQDCMWYDAPAAGEVSGEVACTSIRASFVSFGLRSFFLEILGVPVLDSEEVAARLDLIARRVALSRGQAGVEAATVGQAYLQLLEALEECAHEGIQFHHQVLLDCLRQRVLIPGIGFTHASKCTWRPASTCSTIRSLNQRHDLAEIYGQVAGDSSEPLQHYFLHWLGVSPGLTCDECLEGLRNLRSTSKQVSNGETNKGTVAEAAGKIYRELAVALCPNQVSKGATDHVATAFTKEPLIFVPSRTELTAGKTWLTVEQCLWQLPAQAPQGWKTSREELASHYACGSTDSEVGLKHFFTERLGVPMSVRFQGKGQAQDDKVPITSGQPTWLVESAADTEFSPTAQSPFSESGREFRQAESGVVTGSGNAFRSLKQNADREMQKADETIRSNHREEQQGFADYEGNSIRIHQASSKLAKVHVEMPTASSDREDSWIPSPPEPHEQMRGVAADGRRDRRRLLERLARSVLAIKDDRHMISAANKVRHKAEECLDCNPQHDLYRVGFLEYTQTRGQNQAGTQAASIPVWIDRGDQERSLKRLQAASASGYLEKFAQLLFSISSLFSVPCLEQVHIFEEDTQTVAFNGGALFFNLRYFVEECHANSWEEAVSFWTISFAHELAHFESPLHDRQHGRAMEQAQRAILPGLPRVLACSWEVASTTARWHWHLQGKL
ncbi:unnamed protein product [Polarella glacialis]|uniref:Sacsin/Nov domain-containing protein n=1 Tax=Polarella glacialis TaxID=89957 RepID=A0A813DUX0_POLGL|nr:unnamed protein product [Polarella glacialis]